MPRGVESALPSSIRAVGSVSSGESQAASAAANARTPRNLVFIEVSILEANVDAKGEHARLRQRVEVSAACYGRLSVVVDFRIETGVVGAGQHVLALHVQACRAETGAAGKRRRQRVTQHDVFQ